MFIARLDMSQYSEETVIFEAFAQDRNSAILKAVKEYILHDCGSECRFPAYILVKGKETLTEDEVLEICNLFRNEGYSIESEEINENYNQQLDLQEFEDKEFYYKDNVLYITEDSLSGIDIIEITEAQSTRIEDIKYEQMISINSHIPLWAAKYLYNNTDDEGLKDALIAMSDLKFFL